MSRLPSIRRWLRQRGPASAVAAAQAIFDTHGLSHDDVHWGYRLFLDREPGPLDDVAAKASTFRSTRELRAAFLNSPEYSLLNPGGSGFVPIAGRVITELPGDLRLYVDLADRVIGMNILHGIYELEEAEFVRSLLAPGDHVLDVGANIGYFSVQMASWVGQEGSVVAFEPVPANLALLTRSIAENGFENRIRVVPGVVANEAGETDLLTVDVRHGFNSGGAFIVGEGGATPFEHRRIRVTKIPLDGFEMPRPVSFIKLDVEGAEGLALRGARQLLQADRPTILAEINPGQLLKVSGLSAEELIAEMSGLGFVCRRLENGEPGERIRATDSMVNVVFAPTHR